ncbi:hypothetical protein D3C71_1775060 [compost metagenome]
MINLREEATGGNKQAAGIAIVLYVLCQHVVACQQFLLWAQGFVQQQLTTPGVNLLAVIAQAVIQQRFAIRPEAFKIARLYVEFFCQHF